MFFSIVLLLTGACKDNGPEDKRITVIDSLENALVPSAQCRAHWKIRVRAKCPLLSIQRGANQFVAG